MMVVIGASVSKPDIIVQADDVVIIIAGQTYAEQQDFIITIMDKTITFKT